MKRLREGCTRLGLAGVPSAIWQAEAGRVAGDGHCMVKLIAIRTGGRGYEPASTGECRRLVLRQPLPQLAPERYQLGFRLRWCRLRLAVQPRLAGIKHLNRLEQVLARSEWRSDRIDEGLCLDRDGFVVCATAANVFIVRNGRLLTPTIDRCGVAGVARAWLLRRAARLLPVGVGRLTRDMVETADEVFLSNAVRGVMPVVKVGSRSFAIGPVAAHLGYTLSLLGIGHRFRPTAS